MAIIRTGSFGDLNAQVARDQREGISGLDALDRIDYLEQATADIQPVAVEYPVSAEARGITLKSLKLTRDFEGFMKRLLSAENEIFFLSTAYDLSGESPIVRPPTGTDPDEAMVKLAAGEVREFMGEGVVLFPQRQVSAGIALRVHLFESDKGDRRFGEQLAEVVKAVEEAKLTSVLKLLALATGGAVATLTLVEEAAVELSKVIAAILKANSDDYVDFFEGYFPVSRPWGEAEHYTGHGSEIELSLFS